MRARDADTFKTHVFFGVEAPNFVPWGKIGQNLAVKQLVCSILLLLTYISTRKRPSKNKSTGRKSRKSLFFLGRFSKNNAANRPFSTWPRPLVQLDVCQKLSHFYQNSKMQSYVVFLVYSGHKKLLLSLLSHIDPVQTILGLVKGSEG